MQRAPRPTETRGRREGADKGIYAQPRYRSFKVMYCTRACAAGKVLRDPINTGIARQLKVRFSSFPEGSRRAPSGHYTATWKLIRKTI
jgi:hypothetical protein